MPQHKLRFLPRYRTPSPLVVSDGRTVLAVFENQNPFGKSFAHFSRMRSSSALLERAMTGKVFLRRNGMQASIITPVGLGVVDELATPDMLLQYSLHEPRRGREDIKAFMTDFRRAFPDLNFWGTADLIAEGDYVVGQWEGGGTHTGPAFSDFLMGSLPPATGRKMHFTGTTVLRIQVLAFKLGIAAHN